MQQAVESRSNPLQMLELRQKFVTQAKKYFGVPYAKRYHDPGTPFYDSPLFLDCCGLVRQVLRDLEEDFGFMIGSWNQAYVYDVLPIAIDKEEDMKPGDLVFISGTYYNPKSKAQIHDIVHVEIWLGEEEKTIGARWRKGVVQVHDSYKFEAKRYHSMKYHFRSIDTWLAGVCKSYCIQHGWRKSQFIPGNRSVFALFLEEDVFSQDQAAEDEEETAADEEEILFHEEETVGHQEEILNHGQQILDREDDIANHGEEIVNHAVEIVNHEGEIVNHEEKIMNHEEEIVNHEEEIVNHDGEIVNHEEEIVNREGEIVNHEEEIVNHKGEIMNHEEEIVNHDGEIVNHEEEIVNREGEIVNHEEEIVNREGEIVNHEEEIVNHQEEIVSHEREIVNHEGEIVNRDGEIMNHEEEIVNREEEIVNHEGEIMNHEGEIVNHEGEIMNHEGEIVNHEEEIMNREGEIMNHEGEIVDHEGEITNHEIMNREGEIVNHVGEIVNHEGEITNHEEEIVNHEEEIMNREGEIVNHEGEILNHEGEIVNHEEEIMNREGEIVNREGEIVKQEDEIVNQEDEIVTEESSNMKGTVNLNINSTDETYAVIPGNNIHAVAKFGSDTCNGIAMQDTIVEESSVGVVDAGAPTKGDIPFSELHCVEPVSSTMHSASSCFKVIDCMQYYRNEWWASAVRCPNDNNSKRTKSLHAAPPPVASVERRVSYNSSGRCSSYGQNNNSNKYRSSVYGRVKARALTAGTHQPTFFLRCGSGEWMIKETLLSLGWKRVEDKYDESVSLKWNAGKTRTNRSMYNTFREGAQLVNRISNIVLLTSKIGLLTSLQEYHRIMEKTLVKTHLPLSEFLPETYGLTNNAETKKFVHEIYKEGEVWICKPIGLNNGKGIYLINNKQQLMNKLGMNTASQQVPTRQRNISQPPPGKIIQRYIANPLLLNGSKFDVRAYMLIASTRPYMVLYHPGYVRLCVEPYTPYSDDAEDLFAHLSNQDVQMMHPLYSSVQEDTLWSYERLQAYIDKNVRQHKELPENWVRNTFEKRMQQIMLVCFESVRHKLDRRMGCFSLLGLDFMVDDNLKVWLLEINMNPGLSTYHPALMDQVPRLVHGTLKLVIEIFEKTKKKQPVHPLQELYRFRLLYNGVGKR